MIRKAFTLIELLIVIVIIGILATAVLSAINPVEQIRKSQDAAKRADAAELLNAIERYYASMQAYPWGTAADACADPVAAGALITGTECWIAGATNSLEASSELKPEFNDRTTLDSLYVSVDASQLVHICFAPTSATSINDPNSIRTQNGGASGGTFLCLP